MKTDDLIDMLARNVEPAEHPKWRMRMILTLLVGLHAWRLRFRTLRAALAVRSRGGPCRTLNQPGIGGRHRT